MTALSALATRVVAEVNDATNNTLSASITGTLLSEVQQYCVDGIRDLSNYVFREVFDNSMVTSANRRSYVVSALAPVPHIIKRLEYVRSSTDIQNIPDVELWGDSMYLFVGDTPLFQEAGEYFNIWYYAKHDTPSAGSAAITLESQDEELPIHYAKAKVMQKAALDQRGLNQDTVNEFLNIAQTFERRYREGLKRAQTPFISYKG
jgi:hypothetical protein